MSVADLTRTRLYSLRRAGDGLLLVVAIAGIIVLTGLPYAFAYASAPADKQFMGIVLNVPDTAQYLSWAREQERSLLIENKLTPESGDAVFFNLFWLGVGRLASALRVGAVVALQLVRPVVGALYLAAIYWFIGLVTRSRVERWVAFLVAALGGGLGWILVLLKPLTGEVAYPLDLYVTEANTLVTVMAFPLAAAATGLLVLVLGLAALAFERRSYRLGAAAGLIALVLGLMHGYDLIVVYSVVGTVALLLAWRVGFRLQPFALGAVICLWSLPAAAYAVYITRASPIWRGVLAQYGNAGVYTPPPSHLLVLFGLPLLLIIAGRDQAPVLQRLSVRELLLRTWLVIGFFLLYIPTDFQIKMLAGWQIPVAILATRVVFARVVPYFATLRTSLVRRPEVAAGVLLLLLVLPANAYLYAWRFVDLGRHDYPYYLRTDEVAALHWLEKNADASDVVLSSLTIGQYVPGIAGNRAFLAHWAQTLNYYDKQKMVTDYYNATETDSARADTLARYGVRFVFRGDPERALGGYDPAASASLREVFSQGRSAIYRVLDASTPDVAIR